MNSQLLAKIIKFNNSSTVLPFSYDNPLLDRNVCRQLARSIIKILNFSNRPNLNSNIRLCVMENIRKICRRTPEGHQEIDDTFVQLLTQFYTDFNNTRSIKSEDSLDNDLNNFLAEFLKDEDVDLGYKPKLNTEVIQALINLNDDPEFLKAISSEFMYWDKHSSKHLNMIKNIWDTKKVDRVIIDNTCFIMKAEIEKLILKAIQDLLNTDESDISIDFGAPNYINELINKCSISPECFQMTTKILNTVLIQCNFYHKIQQFITLFMCQIKERINIEKHLMLYPMHLRSYVILLDTDLTLLEGTSKDVYLSETLKRLEKLRNRSELELAMMLSHYPQWFDVYFNEESSPDF